MWGTRSATGPVATLASTSCNTQHALCAHQLGGTCAISLTSVCLPCRYTCRTTNPTQQPVAWPGPQRAKWPGRWAVAPQISKTVPPPVALKLDLLVHLQHTKGLLLVQLLAASKIPGFLSRVWVWLMCVVWVFFVFRSFSHRRDCAGGPQPGGADRGMQCFAVWLYNVWQLLVCRVNLPRVVGVRWLAG